MLNEMEKLTINLGAVELAQVDVLVEQGMYSNRSDCIRTAVRKHLEKHKDSIERSLTPVASKREWSRVIGIWKISREDLEEFMVGNEKLNISVIGVLIIDVDVSTELFNSVVEGIVLRGKIIASKEIKEIVEIKRYNKVK